MFLQRTPQAHAELAPGQRSLGVRQRALLLLAESTPTAQLQSMYHGEGAALIQQLVHSGYLQRPSVTPQPAPATASSNVAGVRMHLFDLCERLFAKRMPEMAAQLRQLLREARDVPSLQVASLQLLQAVHTHAGAARAQAIQQQLSSLLTEPASPVAPADAR